MSIKTINKLSPLVVALSIASSNLYAGELTSFTNELKLNDYQDGVEKTELTLGKGVYKINDTLKFVFDVDKDFVAKNQLDEDSVAKEGWDSEFGVKQAIGSVAGMDLSLSYFVRYDQSWEADSGDSSSYTAQYFFSPVFDTSFNIADNDYYFTVELWAQAGETDGSSLQDVSGFESNFYFGGPLSENWSFDLAWYNFDYYDGSDYVYQAGTEDYLTYSLKLNDNLSFALEAYYEAYYTPDTETVDYVGAHVKPMIKYKKKIGDDFTMFANLGYDAVKYVKGSGWSNNELEISGGFKF